MKTLIDKIGFEVEGEFSDRLLRNLRKVGSIVGDGSIHSNHDNLHAREFNSQVCPNLIKPFFVFKRMDNAYKKHQFNFNSSCGFHIHFSFKPKVPPEIFSKEFADYFLAELKKKFPEVLQSRGSNRYCLARLDEGEIARKNCDRYRFLNLWGAMLKHGTVEFRIFPSEKPLQMYAYMEFTRKTIQKFLKKKITKAYNVSLDDSVTRLNIADKSVTLKKAKINLDKLKGRQALTQELTKQLCAN